jgi:hypothetical protein
MFGRAYSVVASRLVLAFVLFGALTAAGAGKTLSKKPLRPFYIIGHGANTLALTKDFLARGANGLEMDVNLMDGPDSALCIGHGPDIGTGKAGRDESVPIGDYLFGLHCIARTNRELCLIYFDCKTLAATPEHGAGLLDNIRTNLLGRGTDRVDLVVLISVGKIKDADMFMNITHRLGPREGLMVDGYSNPSAVSGFFSLAGVTNQAFSDGIVPVNSFLANFLVAPAVRKACRLRDTQHRLCFVGTWSVNNPFWMDRYIHMGVDGIVADDRAVWYNYCWINQGHGLNTLARLVHERGTKLGIRLATRGDNPFAGH